MTAPDKIWVEDHGSGAWYDGSAEVLLSEPDHRGVPVYQYTRSDLCTPAPAVAELVERAFKDGLRYANSVNVVTEADMQQAWEWSQARAAIAAWEWK